MAVYVESGGAWRKTLRPWIVSGGAWHQIAQGWCLIGGAWRPLWVQPISGLQVMCVEFAVDRNLWIYVNLRTGGYWQQTDGDGRTHVNYWRPSNMPIPYIQSYTNMWVNIAATSTILPGAGAYFWFNRQGFYLQQQPAAWNDYTAIVYLDDNPYSGAGAGEFTMWFNAN